MRPLMHSRSLWVLYNQSAHNFQPQSCYKALFRSMTSNPARPTNPHQYHYTEDVERLEMYQRGGYHPIAINDKLHTRYRVVDKLGHGSYSTIWLARDTCSHKLVAVKVGIAESNFREVDVLSALVQSHDESIGSPGRDMIPLVLDKFYIQGPNGRHRCYVTAPAKASLFGAKEASYHRLFQLNVARALAAQLALAVEFTHSIGFVHGDIHLGNVLLQMPFGFDQLSDEQLYEMYGLPSKEPVVRFDGQKPALGVPTYGVEPMWLGERSEELKLSEAKILLIDFGEAFAPSQELKYGSYAPASIRPPEVRFEPTRPLSFLSDVWLLASAIWSIISQRPLFDPYLTDDNDSTCGYVDALGILPPDWWRQWEARKEWFTDNRTPLDHRTDAYTLEDRFESDIQTPRREKKMALLKKDEKDAFLALSRSMLSYKPEDRITVAEVLESEWMTKWAMPEYKKLR